MTKNTKGVIAVVTIAALAFGAWYFTLPTVERYAKKIVKLGGSNGYAALLTFDKLFLRQWANALTKGETTFSYMNESYNTSGGTKTKAV